MDKIDKVIKYFRNLREDAAIVPTNSLAPGNIAGTSQAGDDPPVRKKKRNKYIWLKGVRANWKNK